MTAPTPNESTSSRAVPIALGALLAVIATIVVIALLVGGGDDGASDLSAAESARIPTTGTIRQVSFAEGAGTLDRYTDAANDPAVGTPAPDITASYFDNTEVTIDMSDGTPRLVMFFAHWCPHCQAEVTDLTERFAQDGLPSGVDLLAVSTAVDEGSPNYPVSDWFLNEGWPVPVLRDSASSDVATAYGLSGFPYTVAVDGDGNVVARASGQIPQSQFDAMLELARG